MLVTGDTEYSSVEIGDLNEERSELSALSHSSSIETLLSIKSISPKRQAHSLTSSHGSVQHDMNGNPEYEQTEEDEAETPESHSPLPPQILISASKDSSQNMFDAAAMLDNNDLPLLYILRLICKSFLLLGKPGSLIHDRQVRVSLKSLALGCIASIFSLCPKLVLCKISQVSDAGDCWICNCCWLIFCNH